MDNIEQKKKLEHLLFSNDLEELNNRTNQFNVFNALKLQNNEIRHSNFLGWLMTPYENHELGDYFLKEFLKSAIKDYSLKDETELSLSEIAFLNLSDVEIRREYKNIDILIISSQNKFLCIIENKIWTGEHDNQLSRYAEIVENEFSDYKKLYIFLAPETDIECELIKREINSSKIAHYIPMCYEQVNEVIKKVLKFKSKHMNCEVKIFIEHYQKMIERNIMGNTDREIVELCRKIYRENKAAIDLINEHNDFRAELNEALIEVLKEREDLAVTPIDNYSIICFPKNVVNSEKLKFADWLPDNYITHLHFIGNFKWKEFLYLEIAIGNLKINDDENIKKREKLINHLSEKLNISKFNGNKNWSYSKSVKILSCDEFYQCANKTELKQLLKDKINGIEKSYIKDFKEALDTFEA